MVLDLSLKHGAKNTVIFPEKELNYPLTLGSHNLYDENETVLLFFRGTHMKWGNPFQGHPVR